MCEGTCGDCGTSDGDKAVEVALGVQSILGPMLFDALIKRLMTGENLAKLLQFGLESLEKLVADTDTDVDDLFVERLKEAIKIIAETPDTPEPPVDNS